MKLRSTTHLAALVLSFAAMSLATGGKKVDDKESKDAVDPLAGPNQSYVGEWAGPGTSVHVGADRSFSFSSKQGGITKTYNGRVKKIETGIVHVNALIPVKMVVQKPPTEVDGVFRMTMEGIDLFKGGRTGELRAMITDKFRDKGVTATDCPEVKPEMTEFDCTATLPQSKKAKVKVTNKGEGSYHFLLQVTFVEAAKLNQSLPVDINKKSPNMVATVDCGTGTLYIPFGETHVCKAFNAKKKEYVVTLTSNPDGLAFEAKPK